MFCIIFAVASKHTSSYLAPIIGAQSSSQFHAMTAVKFPGETSATIRLEAIHSESTTEGLKIRVEKSSNVHTPTFVLNNEFPAQGSLYGTLQAPKICPANSISKISTTLSLSPLYKAGNHICTSELPYKGR